MTDADYAGDLTLLAYRHTSAESLPVARGISLYVNAD